MAEAPIFDETCGCEDCQAAVSPAAYLAALLDYTLKHVRKNGKDKPDLTYLSDAFFQPFADLPADCQAVDQIISQARLSIEVLRAYLNKYPLAEAAREAALEKAETDYLFAAYTMFLGQLGTSYEEIRRSRSETPENRKALADRLGLTLTEPRPAFVPGDPTQPGDELDQLYFESGTGDPLLTAPALEKLFGLADTTRDPLSDGVKLGDATNQITRWQLTGGEWNENTDTAGLVYLSLTNPAGVYRVEIYRDAAHTLLVGSGEIGAATGTVRVFPQNNSGLSGTLGVAYTADAADISLGLVPTFLSWQLNHLRSLWFAQDHPTGAYSPGVVPPLPLIDPDLIGPDDFRVPVPKANPADPDGPFDLWLRRRNDLDNTLTNYKSLREGSGLDALLKKVLGNPLPDLDALLAGLTGGSTVSEVTAAKDGLAMLGLGVESFTRLMALRAKDRLAQADNRSDKVSEAEWGEVYSILAQLTKAGQFAGWQAEETVHQVVPGPSQFWLSLNTPLEDEWPPAMPAGQPFIDPDVLKLTDLPEWLAGKQAIALWNSRKDQLDQLTSQLKQERETNGFESMLQMAFGAPAAGDTQENKLNGFKNDLNNPHPQVRDGVTPKLDADWHLTLDNFKRLAGVRAADLQVDPAKKPAATDWSDVYKLLAPSRKVISLYPQWFAKEQAQNLTYWQALKAKLPRWRASLEARLVWQQALVARSQPPIIDPRIVEASDLRNVIPGDPAFDLWKARQDQLTTWHDQLKTEWETAADTKTGLDLILKDTLQVEPDDLATLYQDQQNGQSVEKRLAQLQLDNPAFTYLMRLRALAQAGQNITASEWETVYATLTDLKFSLNSAQYQTEETAKGIFLTPEFFKVSTDPLAAFSLEDPTLPGWLSFWRTRQDWLDNLQARLDQENGLGDALQNIRSAVEEATLPALRDALVAATSTLR